MNASSHIRLAIVVLLGIYLFVYPFGILLMALDIVPAWGTWMGGALLIIQGSIMGLWLIANHAGRGLLAALLILVVSWAIEHMGVITGFPFGGYHYTDTLNLKIFDVVPLAVPFAWLMVVPTAVGITEYLLDRNGKVLQPGIAAAWEQAATRPAAGPRARGQHFVRLLLADTDPAAPVIASVPARPALLKTLLNGTIIVLGAASFALLLDLMIEPLAVHINGYWVWNESGWGYYGVPGSNFIAWWVTSLVLAAAMVTLIGSRPCSKPVYSWLPSLLYLLNLVMFVLIFVAHGKLLASTIGGLLLLYLLLARLEPRVVRWVMGASHSTVASADQTGG